MLVLDRQADRILWLDMLRVVSCICVIGLHVLGGQWYVTDLYGDQWSIINEYRAVFQFAVPTFLMISGYLNIKSANISITFYMRKALYVLGVYLFWSFFYLLLKIPFVDIDLGSISGIFLQVVACDNHLWYLRVYIFLLLLTPFLKGIAFHKNGKNLVEYFLALLFVLVYVRETWCLFDFPAFKYIEALFAGMQIDHLTGSLKYIAYYLLGYYIAEYVPKLSWVPLLVTITVFCVTTGAELNSHFSRESGTLVQIYSDHFSLPIFFECFTIFYIFSHELSKIQIKDKCKTIITSLAKRTPGIYLLHWTLTFCVDHLGLSLIPNIPSILIPISAIAIFFMFYLIVTTINHIPFFPKGILLE
ncbi:MAG: acyltransferase [Oscillospiraceae bacterium]|nr:acyltransferase [Oscillospiraceae bacterium]